MLHFADTCSISAWCWCIQLAYKTFSPPNFKFNKIPLSHLNVLVLLLLRVNVFVHPSVSSSGQAVFGNFLLTNCLADCHLSLLVIRPWVNGGWQLAASLQDISRCRWLPCHFVRKMSR